MTTENDGTGGSGGPGFGGPPVPPYPGYPPLRPATNNMAIAALVVGLVGLVSCPLIGGVAIYLAGRARAEISRTGEEGAGFAQAGLILGWCGLGLAVLWLLFLVGYLGFMGVMLGTMATTTP